MAEGIEVTAGISAAADVLNDHVVTVAGKPSGMGIGDGRGDVTAIGLTHEHGGVGAGLGWIVMVGYQLGAVGHPTTNAALQADAVAAFDPDWVHGVGESGKQSMASRMAASRVAA